MIKLWMNSTKRLKFKQIRGFRQRRKLELEDEIRELGLRMKLQKETVIFLCKAKKETYAGKSNHAQACRLGSHDYRYCEGEYIYHDSYFGGERFTGEEVLYEKEQPVYSMNYTGRLLGDGFSGDFLKEALSLVSEETPFRGPMLYRGGDYTYHSIVHGDTEWFQGYEEIFLLDKRIYECYFHGGIIQ